MLKGKDIMQKEMKKKVKQEYLRRVKLVERLMLYSGNVMRVYSEEILDWIDWKLSVMDVKTRKSLTMFGALHKTGSLVRLYRKRKGGGRGLISVYDCAEEEELGLFG